MSRGVHQFLRSRAVGERSAARVQEPQAEREATQEGSQGLAGGADFSQVRLHADADAARQADALGASAFTRGRDIYFGAGQFAPGTPAGLQLLAHELGHVQQQAQHGTALQCQPKEQQAGIGASPPEEAFIKDPDNWGAEDDKVLFGKDDAALDGGDEKAISTLAAQQKQAVYVHVHGYASREGTADYNLNLSAHRAVAVKHLLESLLPAGSKVFVFAHGESKHFGAAEANRRVGISLMGPVESGFKLKLDLGLDYRKKPAPGPFLTPPISYPPVVPPVTTVVTPPGPRSDTATIPLGPTPSPGDRFKLDWRAVNEPGTLHGVRLGERDVTSFETSGRVLYRNLLPLFGHDMAEWWANRVVLKAYESRVTLENPTLLDLSDLEFKKQFPDAKGIPPLPLVTPESLNFVIKHTFGKDIDFHFNLP